MARTNTTTKSVNSANGAAPKRSPKVQAAIEADLKKQRELRGVEEPKPVHADVTPADLSPENLAAAAQQAIMKLMGFDENYQGPSWKRKLAAFFSVMVLAFGAGYLIGQLAGYAMVGIMMYTGSTLLMYLVFALAMILSVYVGMKIGQHVGNYILSGKIDQDLAAAKAKVTGWFGAGKEKVKQLTSSQNETAPAVAAA